MDDFREWLSDNLRYFMLGGAILVIVLVLIFGVRACVGGKKGNSNEDQTTAKSNQENDPSSPANDGETDEKKDASSADSTKAEENSMDTSAQDEIVKDTADEAQQPSDDVQIPALEDGIYDAEFNTDSSMFHVNEANDGRGTLTVENGKMTIHVSLTSKHIVNLFVGTAEDAQKDGAEILQPTTDTVTYSDGSTEEVYGFDVPVEALNQEFDLALLGTKGTWYDHKVSVSDPQKVE